MLWRKGNIEIISSFRFGIIGFRLKEIVIYVRFKEEGVLEGEGIDVNVISIVCLVLGKLEVSL